MSTKYSRSDRLFILASACTQNGIEPNSTQYIPFIVGVCTSKLGVSGDAARELAADLRSAYLADKWQSILYGVEATDGVIETQENTLSNFEPNTPTLNTLKTFTLKQPCTPIKTVPPKHTETRETETAPHTQAAILLRLAQNDMFNGVGRFTLKQARYELEEPSLQLIDVLKLMRENIKDATFEARPGNTIYCTLKKPARPAVKIIPELPPQLNAPNKYYREPPLEKADVQGEKVTWE